MSGGSFESSEPELIPVSALSQYAYCPRRCALIHIEQQWTENIFTAEGRLMHELAHEVRRESRRDVRIETGVPLRSLRLGLIGQADVVEFHLQADASWQPYPVEYKLGKPKKDNTDKVQLCAQALCLEEMLQVRIIEGALFYGRTKHRLDVVFDEILRQETKEIALKAHELILLGHTPQPVYTKQCEKCSLVDLCLPKAMQKKRSVKAYINRLLEDG